MTILQKIISILTLILLCSYTNPTQKGTQTSFIYEQGSDTLTTLTFKEFTLSINRLMIYDEDKKLNNVQKDTVEMYAEFGETVEGQLISVINSQLANLVIEQCYETSVTIMNEGPHCDLINWKHFYSPWKPLKANQKEQFIIHKYTGAERQKFPKTSVEELKQHVKKECGVDWAKSVNKAKTLAEYPIRIDISRYYLKVTGQHKESKQTITKIIIIEVPMGC